MVGVDGWAPYIFADNFNNAIFCVKLLLSNMLAAAALVLGAVPAARWTNITLYNIIPAAKLTVRRLIL